MRCRVDRVARVLVGCMQGRVGCGKKELSWGCWGLAVDCTTKMERVEQVRGGRYWQ